jgi:hypothetical protein
MVGEDWSEHVISGRSACFSDRGDGGWTRTVSQIVRILRQIFGRGIRSHSLTPDSAKTYGNLLLETACRNTNEFPAPVAAWHLSVDFWRVRQNV